MAFNFFNDIDKFLENSIKELSYNTDVLTSGVLMVVVPCVLIWFYYRATQIMAGRASDSFPDLLHDLLIKFFFCCFAGIIAGAGALHDDTINVLKELPLKMAQDLSGEDNIFKIIDNTFQKMTIWSNTEEMNWLQKLAQKVIDAGNMFSNVIKMTIVWIGLVVLAITVLFVIFIEKVFLFVCLAISPIFIAFGAFNATRNYFQAWLNITLTYILTYPVLVWTIQNLLKIFDKLIVHKVTWLNAINTNTSGISFSDCFIFAGLCVLFAIIALKIGDLVASWFGASNSADQVAASGLFVGSGMVKRTIGTITGLTKGRSRKAFGGFRRRIRRGKK